MARLHLPPLGHKRGQPLLKQDPIERILQRRTEEEHLSDGVDDEGCFAEDEGDDGDECEWAIEERQCEGLRDVGECKEADDCYYRERE